MSLSKGKPHSDVLSAESDLTQEINRELPKEFWHRYRVLVIRRDAETLTPEEQQELIALSDQAEEATLRRTRALLELAARRGVPLKKLVQHMGIKPVTVSFTI